MGWLGEIIHMDFPPTVVHCFDHFNMAKCIGRQRNWYYLLQLHKSNSRRYKCKSSPTDKPTPHPERGVRVVIIVRGGRFTPALLNSQMGAPAAHCTPTYTANDATSQLSDGGTSGGAMWDAYADPNKAWYNVPSPQKSPTEEERIQELERQLAERDSEIEGLHHQNFELRTKTSVLKRENNFLTRTLRRLETEHHSQEH
jgi:uncharacterized coiled-coil protein SlyX